MRNSSLFRFAIPLLSLGLSAGGATAGILKDQKGLAWASFRDLTSSEFSDRFTEYSGKGYIMIDVDGYAFGSGTRYSMIWQANTDNRGWAERRDLTDAQYHDYWVQYKDAGMRPLDVEAYNLGGNLRFAGIWVQNKEGIAWSSHRGLTSAEFGTLFTEKVNAGFRLSDIEAYQTSAGIRWSAIWYQNTDNRPWAELRGLTREQYQAEVDARGADGFVVVDYESYSTPDGQRYAAIWEKKPGYAWKVLTNRTELEFANLWRQNLDEGFRLVDFERYDTPSGARYGGIWAENDSRYNYARKSKLDSIIADYRADNNLPGISVAVIRNGSTIYRKGFGFADVGAGKVAHGGTVYLSASVSKVFGGTLAAKLEDEEVLRNGTTFNLDLTRRTSAFLTGIPNANGSGTVNIPNQHTHTVQQLLSHLSCVAHYGTTPGIPDQTTHYTNATAAVQSLWNTGLVNNCTIGNTWSYSTHAFTFAGAVLEQATGRTINQLLQNELITPYGLGSIRVMYGAASLPYNYDRAVPYTSTNSATSYSDNSWKVLGGGIEGDAVDMARFAWKVLNGEIVAPAARDNRMWTRVNAAQTHGLGWAVVTDGKNRRTAEWNGVSTGARSFLRCYRDNGLVIAILSNRNPHSVRDVGTLANDIGNKVLE